MSTKVPDPQLFDKKDVLQQLETYCDDFDTFTAAAGKIKCTNAQLSQCRSGRLDPVPEKILKALKLKAVTRYVSTKKVTPAVAEKKLVTAAVKAVKAIPVSDKTAKVTITKPGKNVTGENSITKSSGNVFEDLGISELDPLLKADPPRRVIIDNAHDSRTGGSASSHDFDNFGSGEGDDQ